MMQNHTEQNLNGPLWAMLVLIALGGLVAGLAKADHGLALLFSFVLNVLSSFAAFVWYCRDSDVRGYRRSLWRNILFNAVGAVFVPWYLLRTRPSGKRFGAMLSLGGFCLLMLVAVVAGGACGVVLSMLF